MKTIHHKAWSVALASILALTLGSQVWADSVEATVDSTEIAVGQPTLLTVTVSGSQNHPSLPSIEGMDISHSGESTQIEIINGSLTSSVTDTYELVPQHEGTFVIPAIGAGNSASQPITLHVGKGSGVATAPTNSQTLPAPSMGSDDAVGDPKGRFGSIQITLPKKSLYVGELVPVEVKVFIPDGLNARVTELPEFTSDGFTLSSLSAKPDQISQEIGDQTFTVLTWHSTLTAVKNGDYPISLKMPESIVVPQESPRTNGDDDNGFDSFFKNPFGSMGMGVKKEITLQSSPEVLTALPLPQANRPADFNGAVGQFEIESSATPTQVNAGDPITLRLKVSGTGNFDRVSPTMLAADSHWKTYSVKSSFEPADSVGYEGVKTFQQPVIPVDASVAAIPSVSFSFFNPETQQYVTHRTAPVSLSVIGSAVNVVSNPPQATSSASPQPTPSPVSELRPNQIEPGSFVSTLSPVFRNPWFIAGQSLPVLALLGGLAFRHQQKPDSKGPSAIREHLAAMDQALADHDTGAFFIHARTALQERFAQQWNLRPEVITLADIEVRLGNETAAVRPIFEMADQVMYSDLHFQDTDLSQWRQIVLNSLAEKN